MGTFLFASLFEGIPQELQKNIVLEDGVLFVAESWKGESEIVMFASEARKAGIKEISYLPDEDFRKKYARAASSRNKESRSNIQNSAVDLLRKAYEEKASDIHIADYGSYGIIEFRCLGLLKLHAKLPAGRTEKLISVIYGTMSQQGTTSSHTPSVRQDARIAKREYLPDGVHSIRVHTEPLEVTSEKGSGCFMALRLLYDRTDAKGALEDRLRSLGYSESDIKSFQTLIERSGLTIIAAPTGHGKSTLLKHIIEAQALNTPEKSYQSIEDPPEYPIQNVKQIMVNTGEKISADADARSKQYLEAIAGAMRSDPDVIMIGEIRFPDAAAAAIDAAQTGHNVWSTLHANSALGIIGRMESLIRKASAADPREYLCDHKIMVGLVYQRLLPVLCSECKVKFTEASMAYRQSVLPPATYDRLMKVAQNLDGVYLRGEGCDHCKKLSFTGQTIVAEVIVTDPKLLGFMRQGDMTAAYNYWRSSMHGKTYTEHALSKIEAGQLDPYMTELRLGEALTITPNAVG